VTAPDLYFGWQQPGHAPGCARPAWVVDVRTEYNAWRGKAEGGPGHSCPDEDCGHHDRYQAETVRVVCRSCGVVHLYRGEGTGFEITTTKATGYGQAPRKVAGLWLYPGAPLLHHDTEPYDYLCARDRVDRLEPEHVVGYIGQGRGKRGGITWAAAALPDVVDRGSCRPSLQYTVKSGDVTFKTVAGAAKWVAAEVDRAKGLAP
jgi:hypothetical protein